LATLCPPLASLPHYSTAGVQQLPSQLATAAGYSAAAVIIHLMMTDGLLLFFTMMLFIVHIVTLLFWYS
jgi:hypothetical protein